MNSTPTNTNSSKSDWFPIDTNKPMPPWRREIEERRRQKLRLRAETQAKAAIANTDVLP